MANKEREIAKMAYPEDYLYEGECIICGRKTKFLSKETDSCVVCLQEEAELLDGAPPSFDDTKEEFCSYVSIHAWPSDVAGEMWNKTFRYK